MEMKRGDLIAITVSKGWAEAVGPVPAIHYFEGNETPTARLFIAKVISITESDGLWVESADNSSESESEDPTKLFVPWAYIIAIRSSRTLESDRHTLGFKISN